jgi:hypothetical protein
MSCEKEIHLGDVKTKFQVRVTDDNGLTYIDISSATVKKIIFEKPNGQNLEVDADFLTNGEDGYIIYETLETDLDTAGNWQIQAYVEFANGEKFHTQVSEFKVLENL